MRVLPTPPTEAATVAFTSLRQTRLPARSGATRLPASSGAANEEAPPSAASGEGLATTGEILASGEAGGAARRAKLAPTSFSGCGEARWSADAVLAGDDAPGEGDVNMAMWTPHAREQTGNGKRL